MPPYNTDSAMDSISYRKKMLIFPTGENWEAGRFWISFPYQSLPTAIISLAVIFDFSCKSYLINTSEGSFTISSDTFIQINKCENLIMQPPNLISWVYICIFFINKLFIPKPQKSHPDTLTFPARTDNRHISCCRDFYCI